VATQQRTSLPAFPTAVRPGYGSWLVLSRALVPLALLLSACATSVPPSDPHPLLTKGPPTFEEPSLAGDVVKFPQKGRVTVVDFWSTACEPCVKMMPAIEALYQERRDQGLVIVGVAIDDNPGKVEGRLKKLGVTYPNLLDDAASSMRGAYQVDELPQTFIFDKVGKLRVVTKGGEEDDVAVIRSAVEALLAEEGGG
jgi:cytochrome c biogenesis protein CcmG/thiol:disulfide interchange protein DsbE